LKRNSEEDLTFIHSDKIKNFFLNWLRILVSEEVEKRLEDIEENNESFSEKVIAHLIAGNT